MQLGSSIIVFACIACGCSSREEYLRKWYSPNSTAEERVVAVSNLVPMGATKPEVERILGLHGSWNRWHGPSYEFRTENGALVPVQKKDYDQWTLEYQVPGGTVALFFQKVGHEQDGFRFVRAAFRRSLEISPNGRLE